VGAKIAAQVSIQFWMIFATPNKCLLLARLPPRRALDWRSPLRLDIRYPWTAGLISGNWKSETLERNIHIARIHRICGCSIASMVFDGILGCYWETFTFDHLSK
jgi:hypothetical protein